MMRLGRRYCVTVMDNWTPLRYFWTIEGARKFAQGSFTQKSTSGFHLFEWDGRGFWNPIDIWPD